MIGEHYTILHDAERVIADPIVRNRGTVGGSLCQADPAEDLSAVAAALRADAGPAVPQRVPHRPGPGIHRRPVRHGARGRRDAGRGADSDPARGRAAPTRRWSDGPATGRSPRPAPTWCWTATRSPTSGIGLAARRRRSWLRAGRRGVPARQGSHRRDHRRGRPTRGRMQPIPAPISAVRSSTSGTSPTNSPSACCAAPPPGRTGKGSDMQVQHHRQRRRAHRRGRTATAAGALSPRHAAAHRNPLGMRHLAVRHLRGLAGRGTGEDLHGAGRDGRRAPGAHRRGPGGRRQARPGAGGLHERTRPAVRILHARA